MSRSTHRVAWYLLGLLATVSTAGAQQDASRAGQAARGEPAQDRRWRFIGDIGGALGGTWLTGASSPTVSTGAGVALSLGVRRAALQRIDAGAAVRVTAQPLRLREGDARWDGGTLTDAQLLGTIAVAMHRGRRLQTDLELGAGLALLSGARTLYPFSAASRVTPATEMGVSLQRAVRPERGARARPLSLFARHGLVRVDPGPTAATSINVMMPTAGWVGRTTVGLRVER